MISRELLPNLQTIETDELLEPAGDFFDIRKQDLMTSEIFREENALIDHGRSELPPFADLADYIASVYLDDTGDQEGAAKMLSAMNTFTTVISMAIDRAEIDRLQPPEA